MREELRIKVGDRVAVYGTCLSGTFCNVAGMRGVVEVATLDGGYVSVRFDKPAWKHILTAAYHPKQLRKLKKKGTSEQGDGTLDGNG